MQREILPNGLTVLVRPVRVAPVAEVQIWAKVGSADERPGEEGLAHFFEHMLFKGTPRRGVGDVAGEVEGAGGRINAYTSFDVTVYHATLPAAHVATGIEVLSDAVLHSLFDPTEIAREIEVVLEEIRRGEDSPGQVLGNALFAEAFRTHPYRAPILGTPASVSSLSHERCMAFHRRWYGPENLMVIVAGDVDSDAVRLRVRAAFADAKQREASRARTPEPPRPAPRAAALRREFERASFAIALPAPPFAHPDAPLLDLLAFVLGEGDGSRLVQRVKEDEELADCVDASSWTPLDEGLLTASVDVDVARLEQSITATARELERVRHETVSRDELDRARTNFLASLAWERESVSGIARKIGSFELLAGDHRAEARYFAAIREATPGSLLDAARRWLAPERATAVALVPEKSRRHPDAGAVAAALARGVESSRRLFAPPRPVPHGGRAGDPALHAYAFANGARLFVAPRREVPVVAVRAAFLGGLLSEREDNAGITSFLSSMWTRGTETRSNADLARTIEALAASIDGFSGRSSLGATLDVPSESLDPALELFADVLLRPELDAEEIEHERGDVLAALSRREDHLGERAFDHFLATLFEVHPFRHPVIGTEHAVRRLDHGALLAHHRHFVRARNAVLAVAGDVDPDAVASRLSTLLAPLDDGPFTAPDPADDPRPDSPREAIVHRVREQAHLVIGFRGLSLADEDRFALDVLTQILSGQSGRLFLELRDRRSLAYSVTAANVEAMAPGFFATYIGTAPEKLDAARAAMLAELRRAIDAAPSEAELVAAQRHLVGNFGIDLQRSSTRAAHVAQDALFGLGADAHLRYAERTLAVTREDVLRVARRVIDLRAPVTAIIRP